jgi:hypothetical protein
MNYGNAKHRKELENKFVDLLDNADERQKVWSKLRKKLYIIKDEFKILLPTKLKELMILPYAQLAEIYETYTELELDVKNDLHLQLKELFSYNKEKGGIFKALSNPIIEFFKNNDFDIHTCHYCDMSYINYFKYDIILNNRKQNVIRTQFDLDHVLDKGSCPLVALSLYNLVPSCPTCNGPHIKGKRMMDVNLSQRKKLSPTSELYDFDNKVKIWLRPKTARIPNTVSLKHLDDYEVDFDTLLDEDYEKEIDFFYLRERYNYHKCEALRLAELKVKYTSSQIIEMAKIICNIGERDQSEQISIANNILIEQIRRDIFGLEFSEEYHRTLNKLRKDILDFNDEE